MGEKICCVCGVKKSHDDFYGNNYNKDKKSSLCKSCHLKTTKEYRDNNPNKIKEANRRCYENKRKERIEKQKEWTKNNPDKVAAAKIRRKERDPLYARRMSIKSHGISVEYFYEMYIGQNCQCWTCGYKFNKESEAKIDHCHASGIVRGLLCSACNTVLGLVKEEPKTFRFMIEYLNNNKDGWKAF